MFLNVKVSKGIRSNFINLGLPPLLENLMVWKGIKQVFLES
jgi:hypothetical protein